MRLQVHVRPAARSAHVGGTYSGGLVVKVRERAVDGAANEAVLVAVADAFGVRAQSVELLRGRRERTKYLMIHGDERALEQTRDRLLAAT
jgi:uncharacterized protein YggU (UPF0235/DUF167 family)